MKKLLVAGLLSVASFNLMAGGVDGGGGNIGTTPISDVVKYIEMARKNLEGDNYAWKLDPASTLVKLTNDENLKNMLRLSRGVGPDFLKKEDVIIETTQGCKDANGDMKDGVIVVADPKHPKICLSAYRISRLPSSSVYKEVTALLIHEILHASGANEEQAQKVQLLAIENMDVIFFDQINGVHAFTSARSELLFNINNYFKSMRSAYDSAMNGNMDSAVMALIQRNVHVSNVVRSLNNYLTGQTSEEQKLKLNEIFKNFKTNLDYYRYSNGQISASELKDKIIEEKEFANKLTERVQMVLFNQILFENSVLN